MKEHNSVKNVSGVTVLVFCTSSDDALLSMPMGLNYVVIGFDMEVRPLVTDNAAWPLCCCFVVLRPR